jgi:hypothetical protein
MPAKGQKRDVVERFLEKIIIPEDPNGCWLWTSVVCARYGVFTIDGKLHKAHRLSYQLFVGVIPNGLTIDHLCRNRLCMNPEHLEPVTAGENSRRHTRMITHCAQGHEFAEKNTGIDPQYGWRYCKTCKRIRNATWTELRRARRAA